MEIITVLGVSFILISLFRLNIFNTEIFLSIALWRFLIDLKAEYEGTFKLLATIFNSSKVATKVIFTTSTNSTTSRKALERESYS